MGFFTGKMNMAFATLWRVLCSTQATAKASPSTGAYLDASPVVNLLPASTLCQLFSQQPATLVLYPQLFWVRWRPIHIPRAVVIPEVKDLLSKARRCSCPHRLDNVYLVLASLSSTRMCFMMNQSLWKLSTWLVRPNQLWTPMMSFSCPVLSCDALEHILAGLYRGLVEVVSQVLSCFGRSRAYCGLPCGIGAGCGTRTSSMG